MMVGLSMFASSSGLRIGTWRVSFASRLDSMNEDFNNRSDSCFGR